MLRHESLHLSFLDFLSVSRERRRPIRRSHAWVAAGEIPTTHIAVTTSRELAFFTRKGRAESRAEGFDREELLDLEAGTKSQSGQRVSARETRKVNVMPLIQLLEVLVVVGVLLWLVNRFIPMQGTIKSILNGVVVIAVVLWLLNVFGLIHNLTNMRVGKG